MEGHLLFSTSINKLKRGEKVKGTKGFVEIDIKKKKNPKGIKNASQYFYPPIRDKNMNL